MAEALTTTLDIAKGGLGNIGGFGRGLIGLGAWLLFFVIVLVIIGVGAYLFIRKLKFNKKIIIFEKIGNHFEPTKTDRAMEVKFSTGGDTIFYLQKHKKYMPSPELQTGRRVYWYWIREDGEWINFCPGDFDEDAKRLHAHFLDKEVRFARTQIQKGLKERYDKPGFWKQYGILVFSIGFIAMIGIMTWLLFDKWIELAATTNAGVESAGLVMKQAGEVLSAISNVCSGGSGYKSV